MIGALFILGGIAIATYNTLRTGIPFLHSGIFAVIPGLLIGGFIQYRFETTCYVMVQLFSHRYSEMVSFQRELLEKYHDNGVINDETYQQVVDQLKPEAVTPINDAEQWQ
jgi:hypothetical protein